jgi:hypothetical protein
MQLLAFVEDVVRLLFGDRNSGRLTGENTLSEHSGADFLDALPPETLHGSRHYMAA